MDYVGIFKLVCCIERLNKEKSANERYGDIKENLSKIEDECKSISEFNKTTLASLVPIFITALKDSLSLSGPMRTYASMLAYEKSNELINYNTSFKNILNEDERDFYCCIGHWGKHVLLTENGSDTRLIVNEIINCFRVNTYIAGKLFSNELTKDQKNRLEKLSSGLIYVNRPKEIQNLLIREALFELRDTIINQISIKYEL